MLAGFLLSLREGLEAALIIGIVLGVLKKLNRPELKTTVWAGALSAAGLSALVGLGLYAFGATLEGQAEEIFEGATMLMAAAVLTWMIFWMQAQSRSMRTELESGVRQASQAGGWALFMLAFLAVLREGIELSLFLTAVAFAGGAGQTLLGAALGLGGAALLGVLLFGATVRLNLRSFFQVTGVLLILFAAGLAAHGVHEFNEVGWIPAVVEHVWDINFILDEGSLPGQLLAALFGYNGNPSLTEVMAYLGYFLAIGIGLRLRRQSLPAVQKA